MKQDGNKPGTQPISPPTLPPKPPAVAAASGDPGGEHSLKPDYGCHEALWALSNRYAKSDIHGANLALIEMEQLLRDHIDFPSYKFQLAITLAQRSDIASQLGDVESASSIMAEALTIMADTFNISPKTPMAVRPAMLTPEGLLKFARNLEAKGTVKWRRSIHAT